MTDLTDRMRTCAAFILSKQAKPGEWAVPEIELPFADAANLLIEAANALEVAPVAIETIAKLTEQPLHPIRMADADIDMTPIPSMAEVTRHGGAVWYSADDTLPTRPHKPSSNKICPKCDSRANKITRIQGNRVMLTCPVCATAWEFKQ